MATPESLPPSAAPGDLNLIVERAKRELEQMIDMTPDVMLLLNTAGVILRANRPCLTLLGLSRFKDVIGKPLARVFGISDPGFVSRLLASPQPAPDIVLDTQVGDQTRSFRLTVMPADPSASWRVVLVEDVEDERRRVDVLERQYKREAVRALMGALMHHVNQPLTVILVKAQLMKLQLERQQVSPEALKDHLQHIIQHTLQIAGILQHLENPKDFATEAYVGAAEMLDVRKTGAFGTRDPSPLGSDPDVLGRLVEIHLPGYLLHAQHVGRYSEFLARKLGLPDRDCAMALSCGYCHDLGKIGIPDAILGKQSRLTADEVTVVKTHSKIGYDLLTQFPFMEAEAEVAWTHHERIDGQGYPRGIAGEAIPLMARIVAVADAYDVIRDGRSYCAPRTPQETLAEIVHGEGSQFDGPVVRTLVSHAEAMDRELRQAAHAAP